MPESKSWHAHYIFNACIASSNTSIKILAHAPNFSCLHCFFLCQHQNSGACTEILMPASNFSCHHYFSWCLHQNFDAGIKFFKTASNFSCLHENLPALECFHQIFHASTRMLVVNKTLLKKELSFLSLFCLSQHPNVACNS